jgi:type I restriction enzyme R subunit
MTKESEIEQFLIDKLVSLKYTYRQDIQDRKTLEDNFRQKFEALNSVHLTDTEFSRLIEQIISPNVFDAAKMLRERNNFEREDGTPLNYTLVNIKDWCKNTFEVVNQLRINTQNSYHRYDVILLINGVPIVQIELKSLEVSPRRAMAQIVGYKEDTGNGYSNTLLCFIQLFVVSNRVKTWYFSNNSPQYFSFDTDERFLPVYEFADKDNKKIPHLDDFAKHFFAKCTLAKMISRYMVLVASEKKLMIMRPYQIYAVKAIVDCIERNQGNGYIWHTTGSGKTLTSFKASTLLKDNPNIKKCLFVVDRKDLDKQTREEFNKFQENCVEENTNTHALVRKMQSDDYADKVIVTTIQKLGLALDGNNKNDYKKQLEPLKNERIIFIFDECHRSQFGENHKAIKAFFPKAQLFGFTGTPIFDKNANYQQIEGQQGSFKTTKSIFQNELHTYTITNAIDDRNVLGFHVDHFESEENTASPQIIVKTILNKHNAATSQRKFNAIFATASINHAIQYHQLFKDIQTQRQTKDSNFQPLNIACVFSPPTQELAKDKENKNNKNISDIKQLQDDLLQEKEDNKQDPAKKKATLKAIIKNYNEQYSTNHDINNFDQYYQDVQKRIKDQKYSNKDLKHTEKIDIVIVVDMLLTGFDSKYLNTLYIDKDLKYHGLIQAFSRTNRILNDTKPCGNILDFRGQEASVDEAIELFSIEKDKYRAKEIWLVPSAPEVIKELEESVAKLDLFMNAQGLESTPEAVANLKGDEARGQFVNLSKEVQRTKVRLDQYTDLSPDNKQSIEQIISKDDLRSFHAQYLETAKQLKIKQDNNTDNSDPVQQLDFELILFASNIIDYDYIIKLIANYAQAPEKHKMTREELISLLKSSANLMDERDELIEFINILSDGDTHLSEQQVRESYHQFKNKKSQKALSIIAKTHALETLELQKFVDEIMDRMIFDGDGLSDLFTPQALGWKERSIREVALMKDLKPLLNKMAQGRDISGLGVYE